MDHEPIVVALEEMRNESFGPGLFSRTEARKSEAGWAASNPSGVDSVVHPFEKVWQEIQQTRKHNWWREDPFPFTQNRLILQSLLESFRHADIDWRKGLSETDIEDAERYIARLLGK